MKKSIITSLAIFATLGISSASADDLGFEVGYSYWKPDLKGFIKYNDNEIIDRNIQFENDLGFENKDNVNVFYAAFEHPIPVLPNIKLQYTDLKDSVSNRLERTIEYDGDFYVLGDTIKSSYDLSQYDFIFYYQLIDNENIGIDLGLNGKYIDGSVNFKSTTTSTHEDFEVVIPMVYARTLFNIPDTGLGIDLEGSYVTYSGNTFYDAKAALRYESPIGLGVEAGYRAEKLNIDDLNDFDANLKFGGLFASIFYKF